MRDTTPQRHRLEIAPWTLPIIGELIQRKFGKQLSRSAVGRVLRWLRFTLHKPLNLETAVESSVATGSGNGGAVARGRVSGHCHGDQTGGRHLSVSMLTAVSGRGDMRFMIHQDIVNAKVFREFLKHLMANATRSIFLVVDGHPIHMAKLMREYVAAQNGRLKLSTLPPYSPRLNPDNQVRKHVKANVAKRQARARTISSPNSIVRCADCNSANI